MSRPLTLFWVCRRKYISDRGNCVNCETSTASAAFDTWDAEIVYRRQKCEAASLEYRHSSSKEDFVGLTTLWDVLRVSWLGTSSCPHRGENRARGRLKAWATTLKEDLEPLPGPWVFGYARWRKDWGPNRLVMPTQPAPGECHHKHKYFNSKPSTCHQPDTSVSALPRDCGWMVIS